FHGNNKSYDELNFAFVAGVRHIVVDNSMELEVIATLATAYKQEMEISLRLNVGVEAHTHEYIITSHIDSKFGMAYESAECKKCLERIDSHPYLTLEGFHSHIGSQIFDTTAWYASIDILTGYLRDFPQKLTLNIGGGFGIKYTEKDAPPALDGILQSLVAYVESTGVPIGKLMIEPGRSLVGEAGCTLYTVGYQKETPGKKYYFVDGGMGDNMRPSLYQALYHCDLANKMELKKSETVTIAGKYCESGDILIKEAHLPPASPGDLLVVYATGAYGYSMSSQYNRNAVPGVVFCKDGKAREVIRRQSFEDLIRNEIFTEKNAKPIIPVFETFTIGEVAVNEG
ncbi:MAG: diaminopimelate decarboxylase, partial [Turicibacter sp.]|nr:diaminopimelate decarboxylase [Turicibacter sp.]